MKKFTFMLLGLLTTAFFFSGCGSAGGKSTSLGIIYLLAAALSLLLLFVSFVLIKKKNTWIILLFSSVFVVNAGYTLLAFSNSLNMALWANRLAYFGSVFLAPSMLVIILNVTHTIYKKRFVAALMLVALVVFLIAASPGILDIYYKSVSFKMVNGVGFLNKEYGALHVVYLVYLLGLFAAMVTAIVRATLKKTVETPSHSVILAIAVFVNIGVWFIEQLVQIDFEFLSVSYIISELFLLGVHLVLKENQRLKEIVKQVKTVQSFTDSATESLPAPPDSTIDPQRIEMFVKGLLQLTNTEKTIYNFHVARVTSKEIMESLNIKENTLKYHNKNIYGKLGVSSRRELLEIYKHLKAEKEKFKEMET